MHKEKKKLLIFGFGGHARSVCDVAIKLGYQDILFYDVEAKLNEKFYVYNVIKKLPNKFDDQWEFFPASGDNKKRAQQIEFMLSENFQLATIISPLAVIGIASHIEKGSFVGHNAYVGPNSFIGKGSIINTAAIVEHDCSIGEYCHISINATIAGSVKIGDNTFVGAAATVIDKKTIASNTMIGAGSVVIRDIQLPGVYVGNPAHKVGD